MEEERKLRTERKDKRDRGEMEGNGGQRETEGQRNKLIQHKPYSAVEVLAGITLHRNSQALYGICNGRNHCNRDNGTMY